jgi:tetratricopeptide (TPR) repeat protein
VKNALAIDNGLGEAYASLAEIHAYYKRYDEVETAYQKTIELSPNFASAYSWYSDFLGRYPLRIQEQADLARKAVELDPRSSVFRANLGQRYRDQGLYTLAEGQFQKVIELNPDFAPGYSDLAFLYMFEMSQFDKALPLAKKAIDLDPGNHWYNMLLVFNYMQLGDLEAIQKVREKLVSLGAEKWRLGLVDVLINYDNENPADTLEVINRLLPEIQHSTYWVRFLGFIALTQGDIQLSREIYLSLEPGWLEPDQWPALIERTRNYGCIVAWVLMNTGD